MVQGCSFYSCLIVQLHTSRSQASHKVRLCTNFYKCLVLNQYILSKDAINDHFETIKSFP